MSPPFPSCRSPLGQFEQFPADPDDPSAMNVPGSTKGEDRHLGSFLEHQDGHRFLSLALRLGLSHATPLQYPTVCRWTPTLISSHNYLGCGMFPHHLITPPLPRLHPASLYTLLAIASNRFNMDGMIVYVSSALRIFLIGSFRMLQTH